MLGASLRWIVFPTLHCNLLMKLFHVAIADGKKTSALSSSDPAPAYAIPIPAVENLGVEPGLRSSTRDFLKEVEWRELVGARAQLVKANEKND